MKKIAEISLVVLAHNFPLSSSFPQHVWYRNKEESVGNPNMAVWGLSYVKQPMKVALKDDIISEICQSCRKQKAVATHVIQTHGILFANRYI